MNQDSPEDCGCHVQPDVQTKGKKHGHNPMAKEPQRQDCDEQTGYDGIEYLFACVELQMLLVASADAGDADEQKSGQFGVDEMAVVVDEPPLHAVMDVHNHTSEVVEHLVEKPRAIAPLRQV